MISATEKIASIIKLSQNENPFGASPKALQAIMENFGSIFRYPEILNEALKTKIADKFNTSPENIALSAGSVEMIDIIIKAFIGFHENVVTSELTFVAYSLLAKVNDRQCKRAGMIEYTASPENLVAACDEQTRVVFIANPNNPTGTLISHDELKELLQTLPSNIMVVIDEAYAEYVFDESYPNSFELQKTFHNLIIMRTFSKIYGLAGLRIGYAIAQPDIVETLRQHRTPFSVNRLAAVAAAAALDDEKFTRECAAINDRERSILYYKLFSKGYNVIRSQGNFIYLELKDAEEKFKLLYALKENGILARDMEPFGACAGLRLSVGRPDENKHLIDCLYKISLR